MNESNLKPCPFCGGEATMFKDEAGYHVECVYEERCKMLAVMTESFKTEEEAIAAWNRRASNE